MHRIMDMTGSGPENENDVIFVGSFSDEAAEKFTKELYKQSEQKGPECPLIIYINSPGGEVTGLTTMLSAMDSVPNKLITVAMGQAASAGAVLLAHGAARFASPYSRIMVHQISTGMFGNIADIEVEAAEARNINDMLLNILSKDTKKSVEELKKLYEAKRDIYMSAEEAQKFGLVDSVGIPRPHLQAEMPQAGLILFATGQKPDMPKGEEPTKKLKKKRKTKKS